MRWGGTRFTSYCLELVFYFLFFGFFETISGDRVRPTGFPDRNFQRANPSTGFFVVRLD